MEGSEYAVVVTMGGDDTKNDDKAVMQWTISANNGNESSDKGKGVKQIHNNLC